MGMRLSGLVSNMDTDSLVEQLMAAQRTKVTKIENKKTKLTWTQEKWKDLNTKIYKLYTDELSKLRLQTSFSTFKASSTNEDAVSVTTSSNAPIGSQSIAVNQLASAKAITGAVITTTDGSKVKSSTKLSEISKQFEVNDDNGIVFTIKSGTKEFNYNVTKNSTISDLVSACKDAGLNANFDEKNQRLYISSRNSGEENDFTIEAKNWTLATDGGNTERNNVYDMFTSIKGSTGNVVLTPDVKSQINLYLNEYAFATSEEQKTKIVQNISNFRTSFIKSKIEEELKTANPDKEITKDEIENEYKDRFKDEEAKSILEEIKGYSENYKTFISVETENNEAAIAAIDALGISESKAQIIDAQDSKIVVNGVLYKQASNLLTINGLTINAKQVTDGRVLQDDTKLNELTGVSVSVTKDNQGAYDMVKNFVKAYNEILKEMNTLYYADSSRGYDPLTDDEKEAMTDNQIEKWETKIKDSLLRRDSTLGSLITAMKSSMNGSVKVTTKDGKESEYSLSRLGIMTSSDYSEKGLLHIYGDSDDSTFASETDKLMAALEDDPDAVMQTITGIAKNLYSTLTDKMKSTSLSSALTVYNDKQMDKQQTQYAKDIKALETKLEDMESSYYKKFSAMETALAKLQQNTSALSSLMGNSY